MNPTRTARTIWLGMLAAVAVYLVVLIAVVGRGGAGGMQVEVLRWVLGALALLQAVGIVVLRARPAGAGALPVAIVCWALAESIGAYGLVLGILARDVGEGRPFLVVAAALLLWLRPRPA